MLLFFCLSCRRQVLLHSLCFLFQWKKKEAIYFLIVSFIYSIRTRRYIVTKREREHCKYGTLNLKRHKNGQDTVHCELSVGRIDSVTQQLLYSCTPHPFNSIVLSFYPSAIWTYLKLDHNQLTRIEFSRLTSLAFLHSESHSFEHHQNKVFVCPENLNWHSQKTYTSCHIWEEDPLVLVRTNFILFFSFSQMIWWSFVQGNRHKTPFGNTKEENGLQWIAPFKYLNYIRLPLPLKN
jgi:hypothetical protein